MVSIPRLTQKTRNKLILGTLTGVLVLIWWSLYPSFTRVLSGGDDLVIRFYDVGQGDAILIQKNNTQILVDGGPGERVLSYLGEDLLPWDREIELLVLTHPQADHLTGLIPVLERYQVKRVLYYPSVYETKTYSRFLKAVENGGSRVLLASSGGSLKVGDINLQIIWPPAKYKAQNVNNESVVLVVDYGDFEAILLGDSEVEAQRKMVFNNIDYELIKISHHGASNGAYAPLLRMARAEVGVISVGVSNSYGHPHKQILSIADNEGMLLLRTDLHGTVTVRTNGTDFWYDTAR